MELRCGRCRLIVDFGFPAVVALLFLQNDAALLRLTFGVCLLHEIGHGIAMALTGAGIREIRFHATGMQMRTGAVLLPLWKELIVIVSGPLMNFAAAGILYLLHGENTACMLHLMMGLFNLLPYGVLDGGSALRKICGERSVPLRMLQGFCLALSLVLAWTLWHLEVHNPALYGMLVYLTIAEGMHTRKSIL